MIQKEVYIIKVAFSLHAERRKTQILIQIQDSKIFGKLLRICLFYWLFNDR